MEQVQAIATPPSRKVAVLLQVSQGAIRYAA
jgi:hypothetical protein